MTQGEKILYEMRKRGNRITTFELMDLHISQYQARLLELRENGYNISQALPIENQDGNNMYVLYESKQSELLTVNQSYASPWD